MSKEHVFISGVWLLRNKDHAIVRVEIGGKWYDVISEFIEGPFSHIVEPAGISSIVHQRREEETTPR